MARYIDADKLIEKMKSHCSAAMCIVEVTRQPAADVVEVVRCKECKWWHNEIDCRNTSGLYRFVPNGNWFCASGERRDT